MIGIFASYSVSRARSAKGFRIGSYSCASGSDPNFKQIGSLVQKHTPYKSRLLLPRWGSWRGSRHVRPRAIRFGEVWWE